MPAEPVALDPATPIKGRLWVFVAFDWGEEINLDHARRLAPAEVLELPRRPRTPSSFAYNPPPLRFRLSTVPVSLPGLPCQAPPPGEVTVFDFAGVSVAFQLHFELPMSELPLLAGRLAELDTSRAIVQSARKAIVPLFERLHPAIVKPHWSEGLWEEYFIFHFPPGEPLTPDLLLGPQASWLAGLVHLEDQPLAAPEVAEALRLSLRYNPHDLLVPDWPAAVLLDQDPDCFETLHAIELANLQLLEYRHIDDRLDHSMQRAQQLLHRAVQSYLPFWRSHETPVRVVGELKVEAADLFERTGNVLKLVGDQYLARVYRLLAERFHLRTWEQSIQRKLEVLEGSYQVLADQAIHFRSEFMEIIVIILITVEILLALFWHH
jgi:hypothetical protein